MPDVALMSPEQQRLAEALAIEKQHGKDALRWIAERIGVLAIAGDLAGVERFREIATVFENHLLKGSRSTS